MSCEGGEKNGDGSKHRAGLDIGVPSHAAHFPWRAAKSLSRLEIVVEISLLFALLLWSVTPASKLR
jgi:hypothetical protein